ncbi:S-adenosylmethionine mitochondrial carrier protein [Nematostella vectensis]|uniref:S-adenosylmethionine mitochondrial carrier protein n=1 Tax=Nematostella vectensis TaxID=45351 RepID=UPI0013903B31|nr:S-adenosylmethionine mitochondrial carrier protein [Nematostella vectensis]XP_032228180.1 S-adenosylmethionine mitochondrial carrier protein [Nematostella vectensis]
MAAEMPHDSVENAGSLSAIVQPIPVPFGVSLVAGGVAGTAVDVILYPLDTIKTRLQSAEGFFKAGGFRSLYAGLGSCAAGSAPSAATFFASYELMKNILSPRLPSSCLPGVYMASAVVGEVTSLVVRIPFEVIKQRAQAYTDMSSIQALKWTLKQDGFPGLYRGYWSTVIREVPFAFCEIPLWELLKTGWSQYQGYPVDAWQSSACGGIAGGFAAAITTPLDVAKTRIILAQKGDPEASIGVYRVLKLIYRQQGVTGLFAGVTLRVTWIALGGAVFFGFYDKAKHVMMTTMHAKNDHIR